MGKGNHELNTNLFQLRFSISLLLENNEVYSSYENISQTILHFCILTNILSVLVMWLNTNNKTNKTFILIRIPVAIFTKG